MFYTRISSLTVFFFIALLIPCFAQTTETIQIDTYYPAPYGAYAELTTTSKTSLAIDADQRVGIGTTNPIARLTVDVRNDAVVSGTQGGIMIIGTDSPAMTLYRPGSIGLNELGAIAGVTSVGMWADNSQPQDVVVRSLNGNLTLAAGSSGFSVSPRVSIKNTGNVGIGTENPGTYDGEGVILDIGGDPSTGYAAADDMYLKNPKNGNPRWASQSGTTTIEAGLIMGPGALSTATCPSGTVLVGCSSARVDSSGGMADTCNEKDCGLLGAVPSGNSCRSNADGSLHRAYAICLQ